MPRSNRMKILEIVLDMIYKFCRNANRGVVKAFKRQGERKMKGKQPFHMATCIDPEVFKVMFLFAKMRKVADEHEMGFCGYLITDTNGIIVSNIKGG